MSLVCLYNRLGLLGVVEGDLNLADGFCDAVPPSVSTADAQKKFGAEKVTEVKPYLRYVKGLEQK